MNCRDFIYWLQGAFELSDDAISINDNNYGIILEHIKLAKKDQDEFFEHVCFIEGVLSLWNCEHSDVISHEEMINSQISSYLDSIFTKVTSSEKTLEDFVDQGIIKVEYQTYDIGEDMWNEPGSTSHPIYETFTDLETSIKNTEGKDSPSIKMNVDNVVEELEKSNSASIIGGWVVDDEEDEIECQEPHPFETETFDSWESNRLVIDKAQVKSLRDELKKAEVDRKERTNQGFDNWESSKATTFCSLATIPAKTFVTC